MAEYHSYLDTDGLPVGNRRVVQKTDKPKLHDTEAVELTPEEQQVCDLATD